MTYDALMQWMPAEHDLGWTNGAALALMFLLASFVLVPRTFLCLGVGAMFGLPAVLVILPSTTLGGVLAFLVARFLLAAKVRAFIDARPRLQGIALAVDEEGWRLLALCRFASPLPNAMQNYLFALTRIGVVPFAIVSLVFTIPQIVLYVYLGSVGRAVLINDDLTTVERSLLAIGAISAATVVLLVVRRVRRDSPLSIIADLDRTATCPRRG